MPTNYTVKICILPGIFVSHYTFLIFFLTLCLLHLLWCVHWFLKRSWLFSYIPLTSLPSFFFLLWIYELAALKCINNGHCITVFAWFQTVSQKAACVQLLFLPVKIRRMQCTPLCNPCFWEKLILVLKIVSYCFPVETFGLTVSFLAESWYSQQYLLIVL